jgi:hypothetical protein
VGNGESDGSRGEGRETKKDTNTNNEEAGRLLGREGLAEESGKWLRRGRNTASQRASQRCRRGSRRSSLSDPCRTIREPQLGSGERWLYEGKRSDCVEEEEEGKARRTTKDDTEVGGSHLVLGGKGLDAVRQEGGQ